LLGSLGFAFNLREERIARAEAAVVSADDAIAAATADPRSATPAIEAAELALREARQSGADAAVIRSREDALTAARDEAWGISRLSGMRRVGSLPAALDGVDLRLIVAGSKAYLAGSGLYEIDPDSGQLIEVVVPGQQVAGATVDPIVDAAADRSGLVLSDGSALYRQDGAGGWERLPFAPGSATTAAGQPTASFNRMLYALGSDGAILKFSERGDGIAPSTWAGLDQYPDLAAARDIAIDERIHVLLDDGTIHSFYRGVLDTVSTLPVMPAAGGDSFFAASGGARCVYVVEPGVTIGDATGRVIRFDVGGATQQFAAPNPGSLQGEEALAARALGAASQVAVSEAAGTIYMLSGGDLWIADLPPLLGA
jgi:hypothetical protein